MLVISIVVSLAIGLLVGLLLGKFLLTSKPKSSEDQGREFIDQYKQYQAQVGTHLSRTADIVSSIEMGCKQLSSHLHLSANELGLNEHDSEAQPAANFARMINAHQAQLDQTDSSEKNI